VTELALFARFRGPNSAVPRRDHVLLDEAQGCGVLVDCVIGVRPRQGGWWGEGEVKLYLDGNEKCPTICSTSADDCFCAAWGMACYRKLYGGCTWGG